MKNGNAGGNALSSNIPIPMGMFVNMSHIPPRFFNKQQQAMQQQNYGMDNIILEKENSFRKPRK